MLKGSAVARELLKWKLRILVCFCLLRRQHGDDFSRAATESYLYVYVFFEEIGVPVSRRSPWPLFRRTRIVCNVHQACARSGHVLRVFLLSGPFVARCSDGRMVRDRTDSVHPPAPHIHLLRASCTSRGCSPLTEVERIPNQYRWGGCGLRGLAL